VKRIREEIKIFFPEREEKDREKNKQLKAIKNSISCSRFIYHLNFCFSLIWKQVNPIIRK